MSLSDVAIRRPVFTSMMALGLIVLGIMGLNRLGTDLFPDVTFPVVMVTTVYKGAGPGEIETQVTKPLEDSIAGISGIDKMPCPPLSKFPAAKAMIAVDGLRMIVHSIPSRKGRSFFQ